MYNITRYTIYTGQPDSGQWTLLCTLGYTDGVRGREVDDMWRRCIVQRNNLALSTHVKELIIQDNILNCDNFPFVLLQIRKK